MAGMYNLERQTPSGWKSLANFEVRGDAIAYADATGPGLYRLTDDNGDAEIVTVNKTTTPTSKIKHICFLVSKNYGGSWGVGDTPEDARKKARKILGENPAKVDYATVMVPAGSRLVVQETVDGIQWWTEDAPAPE